MVVNSDTSDTTFADTATAPAAGSENTKGAWAALLPALAFDGYMLYLRVHSTQTISTDTSMLVDIGADPDGGTDYGDLIVVANFMGGHGKDPDRLAQEMAIPVNIPAGSTVAARIQSVIADETAEVAVAILGGTPTSNPFPTSGLVVTYGANTSDSGGVALTNAVANTKAAWVEITGSTTHPHQGVALAMQGNDASGGTLKFLIDIGIGAAASEVVLISDIYAQSSNQEYVGGRFPANLVLHTPIPEGSRLSVRSQTPSANQQAQYDIVLYGWG